MQKILFSAPAKGAVLPARLSSAPPLPPPEFCHGSTLRQGETIQIRKFRNFGRIFNYSNFAGGDCGGLFSRVPKKGGGGIRGPVEIRHGEEQ